MKRGFTLVEMMVAVALFAVVMTISVGALLSLVDANRKAQAVQSVINNLNVALDGMVRAVRMGTVYHCGTGVLTTVQNCPSGGTQIAFESFGGDTTDSSDQWVYWYDSDQKRIYKSVNGGTTGFAITAPEVVIEDVTFYVTGTSLADNIQPKVVITIEGVAGLKAKTRTTFSIQAMGSQRLLDL